MLHVLTENLSSFTPYLTATCQGLPTPSWTLKCHNRTCQLQWNFPSSYLHLLCNTWHWHLTTSPESRLAVICDCFCPWFLSMAVILNLPVFLFGLPLSESGLTQIFCYRVSFSLFPSLSSLVLWVIYSTSKALIKMYTVDVSVQVLYFLLGKNYPLKICPKGISIFFLKFTPPFLSSISSSPLPSLVQTERLIIPDSPLHPSPILSPKCPVLPLKSISNVPLPFYSQSLCSSLGLITSHYEAD